MAKTAVVILNYNGQHFLKQFLPGVLKNTDQADVIVADNCSTDGSIDYIKKDHSEVELIELDQNYGFTGGYNLVINQLKDYKYCVLLNSDVEVTKNWIGPIINFMEANDTVAACQPKILSFNDKSKFEYAGAAGGFLDRFGFPYCRGRIFDTLETDNGQYDSDLAIFWATGAAMFVRVKDYLDAGGLDEDFFAHMEEIDLCWRFQLMGKSVHCIPKSTVFHVGGGTLSKSNPQKTYYNFRNNLSMLFKNESMFNLIWKLPIKMFLDWMAAVKFWKDNSVLHFFAVVKAHWHFILQLPRNLKKRDQVSQLKKALPPLSNKVIAFEYFGKGLKKFSELNKKRQV